MRGKIGNNSIVPLKWYKRIYLGARILTTVFICTCIYAINQLFADFFLHFGMGSERVIFWCCVGTALTASTSIWKSTKV